MTCSHIVECLRNSGTEPDAFAGSVFKANYPSNALEYDTNSHFETLSGNKEQWWSVDFKRNVFVNKYQIYSDASTSSNWWLYNWTISVSNDNETWVLIHGPNQNSAAEKNYALGRVLNTRYLRLDGTTQNPSLYTYFKIYYIKFFGSISNLARRANLTCKRKNSMKLELLKVMLIISS